MKKLLLLSIMTLVGFQIHAQASVDPAEHHIIFQLTSADTNVHKMVVKQLGNVLAGAPNSKLEIVCHGPGITMITTDKTIVYKKIKELSSKGVQFMACENTLIDRKMTKDQIVPESGFVPVGLLEIVTKQEQGWSYVRMAE